MSNKLTSLSHLNELSVKAKRFMLSLIGTVVDSTAEAIEELDKKIPTKPEDIGAVAVSDIAKYIPDCPDTKIVDSHADFNALIKNGYYYIPAGLLDADSHGPVNVGNGWLLVMTGSLGRVKQIFFCQGVSNANRDETYVRTYTNGGWLKWTSLDRPNQVFTGSLNSSSNSTVTLTNSYNYAKAIIQVSYVDTLTFEAIGGDSQTLQFSCNDYAVIDLTTTTATDTSSEPIKLFTNPNMSLGYWITNNVNGGNDLTIQSSSGNFKYMVTYSY